MSRIFILKYNLFISHTPIDQPSLRVRQIDITVMSTRETNQKINQNNKKSKSS